MDNESTYDSDEEIEIARASPAKASVPLLENLDENFNVRRRIKRDARTGEIYLQYVKGPSTLSSMAECEEEEVISEVRREISRDKYLIRGATYQRSQEASGVQNPVVSSIPRELPPPKSGPRTRQLLPMQEQLRGK